MSERKKKQLCFFCFIALFCASVTDDDNDHLVHSGHESSGDVVVDDNGVPSSEETVPESAEQNVDKTATEEKLKQNKTIKIDLNNLTPEQLSRIPNKTRFVL